MTESRDGQVLVRLDVGDDCLVLARVGVVGPLKERTETFGIEVDVDLPLVISNRGPDWQAPVDCLERWFTLGQGTDRVFVLGGSSVIGGAPAGTDRILILDGGRNPLLDVNVGEAWLIPIPRELDPDRNYIQYCRGKEILLELGDDDEPGIAPVVEEGRSERQTWNPYGPREE